LPADLQFDNGLGGFSADGCEYCLLIGAGDPPAGSGSQNGQPGQATVPKPLLPPAPWINAIANPTLGFLVSESGSGYTWAGNSQTNRLTGWSNDPVIDPPSEAVFVRDELTGEIWSPTPFPIASQAPALVRHGQGYTVFERNTHGIEHELTLSVPRHDSVKLIQLRIRNTTTQARQLSATFYADWVLGTTRDASAMHVVTELDPDTGALLARNAFRADYGAHLAFVDVNRRPRTISGDRNEFLGRHGSLAAPAALGRSELSGRVGAGIDPCAAIQTKFGLSPGESVEIIFQIGEAESIEAVRELVRRYWDPATTNKAFQEMKSDWDRVLSAVSVRTPDPAFDLLLNRWLLYQVRSCRLWGRSAFYQSGGAYGFRDQLQDVMSLLHAAPEEARAHILRAASRQFLEGDVQHWWHPPDGRGVRTRISDDFLWLPYVTTVYMETTGDALILDEKVPYLKGPMLAPNQDDYFGVPAVAEESGSLYDHCLRALERGIRLGPHGLPLMGGGDWNDGMNRVCRGHIGPGRS
jgi:cyclic beta-1,2-glucan synthetase